MEDGELKLVKKKVTRRNVPPDIKAVKMLLDGESFDEWTDERLNEEKQKILQLLKENE